MRQLVVTGSFPFTSQTFVTREVASTLHAGHDVRVLAPTTGDAMGEEFCAQVGFPLDRVTYRNYLRYPLISANWRRLTPKVTRAAMREVYGFMLGERRKSYFADVVRLPWVRSAQLIHAHFAGWAYMVALPLARILDVPLTVTAHEMDIPNPDPEGLRYLQRNADAITIPNSFHLKRWAELTGSDERLRLVHNGVDLEEFRVQKPVRNLNGPIRLVSVARLVPHKRVADGIKALARLQERGIRAEYSIIGEGPERARLEALRRELDLDNRVRFFGFPRRQDLIAELVSSDILVHPSERESFGVAVVEGMAAGLPVVVARSEAVGDIVEHGRIGFLYDPGDIDTLVERVSQLARDPALRIALGEAAQELVQRRFSWDAHMAAMYALWEDVLERRRNVQ